MSSSAGVYESLKTAWDAAASTTLLGIAGPYRDLRPVGPTPMPYVVFSAFTAMRMGTTNRSEYWNVPFQLKVYGKTHAAVEDALRGIGGFLDAVTLTLDVGTVLRLRRVDESPSDVDHDDRSVMMGWLIYEAVRVRPRRIA
jgi:hypothetical protein